MPAARSSASTTSARASGTITPTDPSMAVSSVTVSVSADAGANRSADSPERTAVPGGTPAAMCGSSRLASSSTSPGTR